MKWGRSSSVSSAWPYFLFRSWKMITWYILHHILPYVNQAVNIRSVRLRYNWSHEPRKGTHGVWCVFPQSQEPLVHLFGPFRLQNLWWIKWNVWSGTLFPCCIDFKFDFFFGTMVLKSKALRIITACSWLASERGDILIFKQRSFVFLPLSLRPPALGETLFKWSHCLAWECCVINLWDSCSCNVPPLWPRLVDHYCPLPAKRCTDLTGNSSRRQLQVFLR